MKDLQTIAKACALEQERIRDRRLSVWTSGGLIEHVCDGLDLKPLTFQAAIDLCYAKNRLLLGGDLNPEQCVLYVWRNSTQYKIDNNDALARIITACKTLSVNRLVSVCQQHVASAFFEVPAKGSSSTSDLEAVEPLIAIVEDLAARYGVDPQKVLNWDIAKGFALQRAAYIRTIPDYQAPIPKNLFDLRNLYAQELTRQLDEIGGEAADAE